MKKEIILASKSKRRSDILSSCGIKHKIVVTGVKEHMSRKMTISRLVILNAVRKAEAAARTVDNGLVIGVDTLVLLDKKPIGKPKNQAQAKKLLKALSGSEVSVHTGICVLDTENNKSAEASDKTYLKVRRIDKRDIDRYFKILGPYDKAGGFSIEGAGAILFDNLRGSYFNVLGLGLGKLQELFGKLGYDILDFIE